MAGGGSRREHFGDFEFPWDARGEVYVRFGEPLHVSSSEDIRFEQDPAAIAVKERLIHQAGPAAELLQLNSKMHQLIEDKVGTAADRPVSMLLGIPVYPVPPQTVWEYWTYSDVGPGVEVVFVQPHQPGPYEHVRAPEFEDIEYTDPATGRPNPLISLRAKSWSAHPSANLSGRYARMWQGLHPRTVIQRAALKTPQIYRPGFATGPLNFYFDTAQFRGSADGSELEVYNRAVEARSFPGGRLALSDIQLAASVRQAERGRFLKGGVDVIPNPTRAYLPGQPVSIYYEVYNLSQDAFGATRYRVMYEIQSLERRTVVAGVLSALGRLLGRQDDRGAVRIEYEHNGDRDWEQGFLSIDMKGSEPGDYRLSVKVTDETQAATETASAVFQIR